jgi:hypothetical protein
VVAGLVLVIGIGLYAGGLLDGEEPAGIACNGSEQLCDRTLDEVAFAATHNSMSAADQEGWKLTQQERGIPAQLDAGIRGLLIDMYYAAKTRRGIQNLPKRQVGLVGDVYLCHAVCGLGATSATDALRDVRDFLQQHPHEVLVFSIEDHVRPPDIARAFERSGLARYVWRGSLGPGRFPTLREMIDKDQRVVAMAENETGDVPWLHAQFDLVQETPYRFGSPAEVADRSSCRPNRGGARNPLFLLNNWVDTSPFPQARNAALVNAFGTLLRRARTCARLRQRLPNLVAVDFFEQGDVVGVVRALNR